MGRLMKAFSEVKMSAPPSCDIAKNVGDVVDKEMEQWVFIEDDDHGQDARSNDVLSDLEQVTLSSLVPVLVMYPMGCSIGYRGR